MAILAASVTTKSGKVLVSRQFLDMPRSRIEGLMASFPKLVSAGTQHTTVDTDEVRFVYQPLDDLYLVLTTTKKSNILQDINSLHLFARVVAEYCRVMAEREIVDHAFELVAAFDELVSLGYRENVNLAQLRTIALMDSNEERIQEMIKKNKEMEAKEQSRLKAKQMELQRKQMAKMQAQGFGPGAMGGMGGAPTGFGSAASNSGSFGNPGGFGGAPSNPFGGPSSSPPAGMPSYTPSAALTSSPQRNMQDLSGVKTGMKLGAARQQTDIADVFGGMAIATPAATASPTPAAAAPAMASPMTAPAAPTPQPKEPVHVILDERVVVSVNRDGGLQQMEVKGDLSVHVTTPAAAQARVQVQLPANSAAQFKTHPNMDKKAWTDSSTLTLRDASKSFPVGQPSGVLKWRLVSKDESAVPLSINCWPNPTNDGHCEVNIEYELLATHMTLRNVVLAVPIPPSPAQPQVQHVDGDTVYDRARGLLYWQVPEVSGDKPSGSLDFKAAGDQPGAYFPVAVQFASSTLYCPIAVVGAVGGDGAPVEFGVTASCQPDEYKIV
ncbi:coatomer subunit delta [Catenaria anguillulae PL171]|uniref:Coatomer subunit delta n=1 Tax=Catenaria anguillulae PL171 TaxID=765915 RepID=A0A1Y2HZC7_9FUNG|nr:coatomer subunit delta [Catenaria anguillulae PL171]